MSHSHTTTLQSAESLAMSNLQGSASELQPPTVHPTPQGTLDRQVSHASEPQPISKAKTVAVISSVTAVTCVASMTSGLVTIAAPVIASDIGLAEDLLLWPASIFALTCGCALLISGAMADLFGSRLIYLIGAGLQAIFTLACGLADTGTQLIVFRGFAGVAQSMCLPSAVSIITSAFAPGQRRNFGFASMGGGQPLGFALGLVIGGLLSGTVGWRWGFYISTIINALVFVAGIFWLPANAHTAPVSWQRFRDEVDWVGAALATATLAMASYVMALLTQSTREITHATSIALLAVSAVTAVAFVVWVGRQERLGRPAIIPNSLWKSKVFTTICIDVFLVGGAFNAVEALLSFYFQYVQHVSPVQSSLRFLPTPVGGTATMLLSGLILHRVKANLFVIISLALSCLTPTLLAINHPSWPYWYTMLISVLITAIGCDALYTVSNILITSSFSSRYQATAGGVYNTVAQIGKSFGLTSAAAVAASITAQRNHGHHDKAQLQVDALLEGYRAAFWYCLGLEAAALVLSIWGLRKIGKVGLKRE